MMMNFALQHFLFVTKLKQLILKLILIIKFGEIVNMGKKLAIIGHPTRGNEVIKLLEMLGGKNNCDSPADNLGLCYLIDDDFDICAHYFGYDDYEDGELNIFTLEEFLEKFPFKVGDKVIDDSGESGIIIEMKWDEEIIYKVDFGKECYYFASDFLRPYKEANANELKPTDNVDDVHYIYEYKTIGQGTYAIKIADGYKFDSVDENGNIIVKAFKPKPTYPANYDDCCDMLNADEFIEYELMVNFPKLINARNAYWKIAGEEMGLDGHWKPDWTNENQPKYGLYDELKYSIINPSQFVFPTEEMRDAFYKNFDYLIKACK